MKNFIKNLFSFREKKEMEKQRKDIEQSIETVKNLVNDWWDTSLPNIEKYPHPFIVHLYFRGKEIKYHGYTPQRCLMMFRGSTLYNIHVIQFPPCKTSIQVDHYRICDGDGAEIIRGKLFHPLEYIDPDAPVIPEFGIDCINWQFDKE